MGRSKTGQQSREADQAKAFDIAYSIISGKSLTSFEDIYRLGYRMVLQKNGSFLYESVSQALTKWLDIHVQPELLQLAQRYDLEQRQNTSNYPIKNELRRRGEAYLMKTSNNWRTYSARILMIEDCFAYLNRVYAVDNRKEPIYTMASILFHDRIMRVCVSIEATTEVTAQEILYNAIFQQLHLDRIGDIIDRRIIKSCIEMLHAIPEENSGSGSLQSFGDAYLQWIHETHSAETSIGEENCIDGSGVYESLREKDLEVCKSLMPQKVFESISRSVR